LPRTRTGVFFGLFLLFSCTLPCDATMVADALGGERKICSSRDGFLIAIQAADGACTDAIGEAIAYFNEHGIVPWVQELLIHLAENKPSDPFAKIEARAARSNEVIAARKFAAGEANSEALTTIQADASAPVKTAGGAPVQIAADAVGKADSVRALKLKLRGVLIEKACSDGSIEKSTVEGVMQTRLHKMLKSSVSSSLKTGGKANSAAQQLADSLKFEQPSTEQHARRLDVTGRVDRVEEACESRSGDSAAPSGTGDNASSQLPSPPMDEMMSQAKAMLQLLVRPPSRAMSPSSGMGGTFSQSSSPKCIKARAAKHERNGLTSSSGHLLPPALPSAVASAVDLTSPAGSSLRVAPSIATQESPKPCRSDSLPSFGASPTAGSGSLLLCRRSSSSAKSLPLRLPAVTTERDNGNKVGHEDNASTSASIASSPCSGDPRRLKVPKLRLDNLEEKMHEVKNAERLNTLQAQAQRMGIKPVVGGLGDAAPSVEDVQAGLQAQLLMLSALGGGPRTDIATPPTLMPEGPASPMPVPPSQTPHRNQC